MTKRASKKFAWLPVIAWSLPKTTSDGISILGDWNTVWLGNYYVIERYVPEVNMWVEEFGEYLTKEDAEYIMNQ